MTPEPSSKLQEWIVSSFNKLGANPDFLPAYQRFILHTINEYFESDGFDFQENMDELAEPDDPKIGTHADCMADLGKEFLGSFIACVEEGHIHSYAEAYATNLLSDGCESRVSALAYKAIDALNHPWTNENPAYRDVIQACLTQGKNPDFAERCAKCLPDHEFFFKGAFMATVKYVKYISKALSKGRSVTFAGAYAEAWNNFAEVEDVALNYAECFEKLLGAGRSTDEADRIAYAYATKYLEGHINADENLDFEFDKDEALAKAESAYRFRGAVDEKTLPGLFLRICQRKYPTNHSKHWFDDIETLARSVLAGNLKLEDIPRSSYMECLEEECRWEESKKPPRFESMLEEELKLYNSRTDEDQVAKEEEIEFRENCRVAGFDPTDPDSRAAYKETCAECGNAWWDALDPDDHDGWTDNMNRA